jgi:hypothetical protein
MGSKSMIPDGRKPDIPVILPPQMGDFTLVSDPLKLRMDRLNSEPPRLKYKRQTHHFKET